MQLAHRRKINPPRRWLTIIQESIERARSRTPVLYRVIFTDAAKAAAADLASPRAVEGYARRQVASVCGAGFEHCWGNIIFHMFEWPGTETEFITRPVAADAMEIDVVAAWDSLGEHDTGLLPPGEFRLPRRSGE